MTSSTASVSLKSHNWQRAYWLCQLGGWGIYGLGGLVSAALAVHVSWARAAVDMLLLGATGIALSHLLGVIIRHQQWRRLPLRARAPRVVALSLFLSLCAGWLMNVLGLASWQTADLSTGLPQFGPLTIFGIQALNWLVWFLLWSLLYFGLLAMRDRQLSELRQSELARALQAAELRLLKSQLNPHFLFNALNSVRALIAEEPTRAQSAVTQLARLLRYTLGSGEDELVTLEQELAIVDDYLELETLRLGERLRIERDIASQARPVRIPVMLLQILVENAIKHGIAELPAGGVLRIHAGVANGAFVLEVENPRPERRRPASLHEGIGVNNAHKRLHLLFGPGATFDLDLTRPALARARVTLPLTS